MKVSCDNNPVLSTELFYLGPQKFVLFLCPLVAGILWDLNRFGGIFALIIRGPLRVLEL
jgi:hypothetical protein